MKGRAPKSPATGSQVVVKKKCQPNLCRASVDPPHNWNNSKAVMSRIDDAKTRVIKCAIASPSIKRRTNDFAPKLPGVLPAAVAETLAISYWIIPIALVSLVTTAAGSFAYDRFSL